MAEAATLEQTEQWLSAEQAFPEAYRRGEARAALYLGNLILDREVVVETIEDDANNTTLLAAIQFAKLGDETSRKVVKNNVATDVGERIFKVATQNEVEMSVARGFFEQDDRPMTDIHRNTFLYTTLNNEMHNRTAAQNKNNFVFEELLNAGILDTHDALVIELCPTDERTRSDYNFFTDTDSLSMQLLKVTGQTATLQTALVAGKTSVDGPRHDLATVQELAARKNLDLIPTEINDLVQFVMLIPKSDTPLQIEDVVRDFDDINGTFYGQAKPRKEYKTYAQECYKRSQSYEGIVEQITEQLLREAHAFETPLEAIERLDYLSERLCVRKAKTDTQIDVRVFGAVAAMHIQEAREFHAQGDDVKAEEAMVKAQQTAESGSCPLFKGAKSNGSEVTDGDGTSKEKSESKWMNCPHCSAKVFADPCATVLSCWDCKAKVINGITFKGNGGSKKRKAEKAKQRAEQKETQAQLTAV